MRSPEEIDISRIRTVRLSERPSKVSVDDFARPLTPGGSLKEFFRSLPRILAAQQLQEVASHIVEAKRGGKVVLLAMGAHPIKVGLTPLIVQLMEEGVLKGLALNGACMIHDVEIAMVGKTSEDVREGLKDGSFGAAKETADFINGVLKEGVKGDEGAGEALGRALWEGDFPYKGKSLFANGFRLGVPLCVHVAIGTDVIHIHPSMDGAVTGEMSYRDFRRFISLVASLEGGVFINMGSAVLLPEVFLKALSLARNLGYEVKRFVTVNMDFLAQYRSIENVVQRPTEQGGKGYFLRGHHEIMFPLLVGAIMEGLTNIKK